MSVAGARRRHGLTGEALGIFGLPAARHQLAGPETASVTPVRIIACECGQGDCDLTIEAAFATYQAVRMDPSRFLVAKRHRFAGSWNLVASNKLFSIVERPEQQSTNGAQTRLYRVLVVDDDESLRKLYAVRLQLAGLAVWEAADGRQALDRARFHRPDLIITDVTMPRMNGFELAAALRRDERTRKSHSFSSAPYQRTRARPAPGASPPSPTWPGQAIPTQ